VSILKLEEVSVLFKETSSEISVIFPKKKLRIVLVTTTP
jgi:hypothetical protein